jgi:hypothetical protein
MFTITPFSLLMLVIAAALLFVAAIRTNRRFTMPVSALVSLGVFALVYAITGHSGLAGLTGAPFLFGTVQTDSDLVRQLIAWGICDAAAGIQKLRVVAKAANYQCPRRDRGRRRLVGHALHQSRRRWVPSRSRCRPIVAQMAGHYYDFVGVANQTFGVAGAAGTVVTFNNAAATSVACSTAGGKIGAKIRAICDGTSWILVGDTVGGTYTVA